MQAAYLTQKGYLILSRFTSRLAIVKITPALTPVILPNKNSKTSYEEISIKGLRWINIEDCHEADVDYLADTFGFHHLDCEDCLTENQRAKIDEYEDYLFIILHIPTPNKRTKRIYPLELDIFIGNGFLVTIHENHPTLRKIFEACQKDDGFKKEFMNAGGSGYLLYKLLNELFEGVFPVADDLSKTLTTLENDVFESDSRRDRLRDILLVKKDIINFRRIILPQRGVIAQLEHMNMKFSKDNLDIYFDNVVDKIEKVFSMMDNLKDLAESLHQTNESIISHNTNNIIKVLTVFSVVMLPLTLITGFYGMNLQGLPFSEHAHPVVVVGVIMLMVVASMLIYFRIRRWI